MSNKVFKAGWFAGFLMAVAAQGGNWLITPMSHPDASPARKYAVIGQIVICLGASLWLTWRQNASAPSAT